MPHRDQEIAMLRREVEMLMGERQAILRVAGASAALIASLDSKRLPVGAVEAAAEIDRAGARQRDDGQHDEGGEREARATGRHARRCSRPTSTRQTNQSPSRHGVARLQSGPAVRTQATKVSLDALAVVHFVRHEASAAASMHSKKWRLSHEDWHCMRPRSGAEASPVPIPPPPPPPPPDSRLPQAFGISPQALPFTQSIWNWYALFWHSVSHAARSPTLMKLHETSFAQAVRQVAELAPSGF